jgi:hypothetical protein
MELMQSMYRISVTLHAAYSWLKDSLIGKVGGGPSHLIYLALGHRFIRAGLRDNILALLGGDRDIE